MMISSTSSSSTSSSINEAEDIDKIWEDLYPRLIEFARHQRRTGHKYDSEDIAVSAVGSAMAEVQSGLVSPDRDQIWIELKSIALRKIRRSSPELMVSHSHSIFDAIPELSVQLASTAAAFLDTLTDPHLRPVAELKLKGMTNHDVAAELGVSEATIHRRMQTLRRYINRWDGQ